MVAAFLAGSLPVHAQEKKESGSPAVYRVEFEIRGADQRAEHYVMVVDESRRGVFQALKGDPAVGVKLESSVRRVDDKVALEGSIELSEIAGSVSTGSSTEPIIGQAKMAFHTSLESGKPAAIGELAKHQVEATVTALPTSGPAVPR
jgi:hypothetical protein